MKKFILILFGLFLVISCSSSDDKLIVQDDGNPIQEPNDPDRGINMNLALSLIFVNNLGENIFDPLNPLLNEGDLDVDVFGINGYENEYPFTNNNENSYFINFGTTIDEPYTYSLMLKNYEIKTEALQQAFGERGWLQYKITFPDDTVYEVKVEGAQRNSIDYYPTKIFINDELKWQQPQVNQSWFMAITIVK